MARTTVALLAACALFTPSAGGADLPTIKPKAKFQLRRDFYNPEVRVSADGRRAAIVHGGDTLDVIGRPNPVIQVWNLDPQPKLLSEFVAGSYCFALSPSGKRLYTSDKNEVYDVATKKVVSGPVTGGGSHAHFRDDDLLILTTRSSMFDTPARGEVRLWDVEFNRKASAFEVPDNRFTDTRLTANGKELWLFLSNDKFVVECYDLLDRKLVRTVRPEVGTDEKPYADAGVYRGVARDGSAFSAYAGRPWKNRVYDPKTGKVIGGLPSDLTGTEVGILPVGTLYLAVPSTKATDPYKLGELHYLLYDWKAEKPVAVLEGHAPVKKPFNSRRQAVSSDGTTLVSVTVEGEVLVYDLSTVLKK